MATVNGREGEKADDGISGDCFEGSDESVKDTLETDNSFDSRGEGDVLEDDFSEEMFMDLRLVETNIKLQDFHERERRDKRLRSWMSAGESHSTCCEWR